MSVNVQVLVKASKFATILDCIRDGLPFGAEINSGKYAEEQFTTILIDTSRYDISDIKLDPSSVAGKYSAEGRQLGQLDEVFICTIKPKGYRPSTVERVLTPEL